MPADLGQFFKRFVKRPTNFDPEGSGYDYETAVTSGLKKGSDGHWPSRDPRSGQMLKGRSHPTFELGVKEDRKLGYMTYQDPKSKKYYSHKMLPRFPGGFIRKRNGKGS